MNKSPEISGFEHRADWVAEDLAEGLGDLQRTANQVKLMMCAMEPDLEFTTELMTDFELNQIPTLDFSLWLEEVETPEGTCPYRLYHNFYTKPMNTRYCELESAARAWTSQAACMAQEVVRRMLHVSEELPLV